MTTSEQQPILLGAEGCHYSLKNNFIYFDCIGFWLHDFFPKDFFSRQHISDDIFSKKKSFQNDFFQILHFFDANLT